MVFEQKTLGQLSKEGRGFYGIGASAVPFSPDLLTYLRITDIKDDGTLNKSDLKSVADPEAKKYLLSPNDIVFARTGASTGRNYFYDGKDGTLVYAGFLIKFSIDQSLVNPRYIKHYCRSKEYWDWITAFNTGSTRGNINAQTLASMPIKLPPREYQDKVVEILDALDDKIELNNQINENLFQQAMTLFMEVFITDSHVGEPMPLYDYANYVNGAAFKPSEYSKYGLPIIKIAELKNGITESTQYFNGDKGEKYIIRDGDILFSWSGNPDTSIDIFIWCGGKAILNQHTFNVKSKEGRKWFMFLMLKYFKPQFTQIASNKQTTGLGHVTASDLKRLTFPHDTERIKTFEETITPFMETIYGNMKENLRLASLKDTLLPRLMLGEINVSDVTT